MPGPTQSLGGTATAIAAGDGHSCAIVANEITCWGANGSGQLGTNNKVARLTPTPTSITGATTVAAGRRHTCAIISNAVQCWGANELGQLGSGETSAESLVPVSVQLPAAAVELRLRADHSFARLADGRLYAWGDGCGGRLGVPGFGCGPHPSPTQVMTGVAKLAAGYGAVCALKTDASVWCWGGGEWGQNGSGVYEQRDAPAMVTGLAGIKDVATGGGHTCVVNADDTVSCFGYDARGQLGDGRQVVDAPSVVRMVCQ